MDEKEKNAKLYQLIDEMCDKEFSTDNKKMNMWIQILNRIYANGYRHTYSDIFLKIQTIISDDNSETLEILGENLNILKNLIIAQLEANPDDANLKNTYNGFKKFSDHIFLEIGRFNFLQTHFTKDSKPESPNPPCDNSSEIQELKKDINQLSKTIDQIRPITTQAQKELDALDSKLESNKISSITTLTIFSAVVLAFSGGITFEAGIFKGLENSSVYRLVLTIALTGFILFNTIFALLYLVGKLSGKNISTKCKCYVDSSASRGNPRCGDGYCGKQCHSVSIPCRLFHKYSYVFFVNIVLLLVIYIDSLLWLFRNDILNPIHIILQLIPFICIFIGCIVKLVYSKIKNQRMKTKFKVSLIKKLIAPKEERHIFSGIIDAFSSAFGNKTLSERYYEDIKGCDYKEALQVLDDYADKAITLNKEYFSFISNQEHRLLKKQWKELSEDFKRFISEDEDT